MANQNNVNDSEDTNKVEVIRGRYDSLKLYEITENELTELERGSPISIYLNFSIFLISTGLSFLINLILIDITSIKLFSIFTIITGLCLIIGLFLMVLWVKNKKLMKNNIKRIKSRIK